MELKSLSSQDALRRTLERVGLSETDDPLSIESLASILRYSASLLCPCSPRGILSAVTEALQPLLSVDDLRERCQVVLDELIAHGDLVEFDDISGFAQNRLLYLAPPAFVKIGSSKALIVGIAPDGVDILPVGIAATCKSVARIISDIDHPSIEQQLRHAGLHELPYAVWVKAPATRPFEAIVRQFDKLLERQPPSDAVDGLRVLDTALQSPWYRERWTTPGSLTGRYVGTRTRRYGADLWCYVEIVNGTPSRLVDLPQGRTSERGCDQAWRLQCALDAKHGEPQRFRLEPLDTKRSRLSIHLPCPAWLLRRWDCIGERGDDSVFVFDFEQPDADQEVEILQQSLWMVPEEQEEHEDVTDDS